ncbi:MAG TPA: hypothetical protein VF533_13795 [Solirubrobacteraceae bacterium]|jgi:hypothetical protein
MHDHPSSERSAGADRFEEVQRRLLLELVVDPPEAGDRIADLAARLQETPRAVTEAAAALAATGLAVVDDDVVRASAAALRFEALWPVCL